MAPSKKSTPTFGKLGRLFNKLPAELRVRTLNYVFDGEAEVHVALRVDSKDRVVLLDKRPVCARKVADNDKLANDALDTFLALTQLSKTMREEARPIFFANTTFVLVGSNHRDYSCEGRGSDGSHSFMSVLPLIKHFVVLLNVESTYTRARLHPQRFPFPTHDASTIITPRNILGYSGDIVSQEVRGWEVQFTEDWKISFLTDTINDAIQQRRDDTIALEMIQTPTEWKVKWIEQRKSVRSISSYSAVVRKPIEAYGAYSAMVKKPIEAYGAFSEHVAEELNRVKEMHVKLGEARALGLTPTMLRDLLSLFAGFLGRKGN